MKPYGSPQSTWLEYRLEACCHRSREAGDTRNKAEFSLRGFGGIMAQPTPGPGTSRLQSFETIYFCCFQPPGLWSLVIAALANSCSPSHAFADPEVVLASAAAHRSCHTLHSLQQYLFMISWFSWVKSPSKTQLSSLQVCNRGVGHSWVLPESSSGESPTFKFTRLWVGFGSLWVAGPRASVSCWL